MTDLYDAELAAVFDAENESCAVSSKDVERWLRVHIESFWEARAGHEKSNKCNYFV